MAETNQAIDDEIPEVESPLPLDSARLDTSELPFLVTNWLSTFASANPNVDSRVRHAAANLASAFSDAGVFGSVPQQSFGIRRPSSAAPAHRNATFSDMRRRWASSCPPDQLVRVLEATAASNRVVDVAPRGPSNYLVLGNETRTERARNPTSGRTLQDAIDLDSERGDETQAAPVSTSLQRPVLFASKKLETPKTAGETEESQSKPRSTFDITLKHTASLTRDFLRVKDECRSREDQIRRLCASLANQQSSLTFLECHRPSLPAQSATHEKTNGETLNCQLRLQQESEEKANNCKRVIAQLNRQIASITEQHKRKKAELQILRAKAHSAHDTFLDTIGKYRDPFMAAESPVTANRTIYNLAARQMGLGPVGSLQHRAPRGKLASVLSTTDIRKKLVRSGFSHGATINTHLTYPIYCLRFDRSGSYFVTGSDDYLAKLHCIGEHTRAEHSTVDRSDFIAGAVLICTLRGHAGVINDINVSCDNAFLATASEDGDCRVWGLNDGTPIAILRGHAGGSNMVVWSALTPYRLVTAASDGYARVWDIKDAAIKRYKRVIGNRGDYSKKSQQSDPGNEDDHDEVNSPVSEDPEEAESRSDGNASSAPLPLPLPPLPLGANLPRAPILPPQPNNETEPGRFVAGNSIDRGVCVLDKLLHGASHDEGMLGPGTRGRRSSVKVLCVAFCPLGGHFTTGADDGMGRIFSTHDDREVELADSLAMAQSGMSFARHRPRRGASSSKLLKTLTGHLSPITDLEYSYAGDRILTASQKDGVVRIWSWNVDPASADTAVNSAAASPISSGSNFSNIVIKLANPSSNKNTNLSEQQDSRRRPTRSTSTNVCCDAATWVRDDEYIVTSQCEIAKQSTSEIVPGSQYIFVWGSHTGHCLLGINGAHTMSCAVILPHSRDPRMVCSAGTDGKACLWDIDTGRCLFSHQNTVDFGPGDPMDRGQSSAFLDGSFSPDGTHLVLTDDAGRVTVLNCLKETTHAMNQPTWMQEQYFGNDYYELAYDPDGYCIEKGSERPPHLAPKGVRCAHSGATSGEKVNRAFKSLAGPYPLAEHDVRWERIMRRLKMENPPSRRVARGNIVGQYEPGVTTLVSASGKTLTGPQSEETDVAFPRGEASSQPAQRTPQLSRNYRWGDFNDVMLDEDEEMHDSDDDSFHVESNRARRNRRTDLPPEESDDESQIDGMLEDSPAAPRGTSRGSSRRRYNAGEDSSDDELIEYMSSNNSPSGPFKADYDSHYFRVQSSWRIKRAWLLRQESNSSYDGRKSYTPQAGDEVVYIPRAHHETIAMFPSLVPPWQHWPDEVEWPVVRCTIKDVRYRFPYSSYFPRRNGGQSQCNSIVAILVLELTGIPNLSNDEYWPRASFVTPTRKHLFEVSLFESDATDFLVPLSLFVARINSLDDALQQVENNPEVEAFYSTNGANEGDGMLEPWAGKVQDLQDVDGLNAPTLRGSGYRCIVVEWEDRTSDHLCPWEIQVKDMERPARPMLSDTEKITIRKALQEIRQMDRVEECFFKPVDTRRYSDYDTRVEVPMNLEFIYSRVEADYYSNRFSVVSDIKLIRDNSDKYNGEHGDLTLLATEMMNKFASLVLSAEELEAYNCSQKKLQSDAMAGTVGQQDDDEEARPEDSGPTVRPTRVRLSLRQAQGSTVRRSQRVRQTASSTLESLPPPQGDRGQRNSGPRVRLRMPRQPNGESNTSRIAQQAQQPPAVSLDAGTRGRTTRNSRGQQPSTRQLRSASGEGTGEAVSDRASRYSSRQPQAPATRGRQLRSSGPSEEEAPVAPAETGRGTRSTRNSVGSHDMASSRQSPQYNSDPSDPDSGSEYAGSTARRTSTRSNQRQNPRPTRSQLESIASDTDYESLEDEEEGHEAETRSRRSERRAKSRSNSDASYGENSADLQDSDNAENDDDDDDKNNKARAQTRRRQATNRASRARRRSTGGDSEGESFQNYSEEESEDESGEEPAKPKKRQSPRRTQDTARGETPRSRRSSRLSLSDNNERSPSQVDNYDSEENQLDTETSEYKASSEKNGRNRRARQNGSRLQNERHGESEEEGQVSSKRWSSRGQPRGHPDSNPNDDRLSAPNQARRSSRASGAAGISDDQPTSGRRAVSKVQSYVDPDSSEFDTDGENFQDYLEPTPKKRKAKSPKKPPPKKKTRKSKPDPLAHFTDIKEWPDVELKHITPISRHILKRLRDLDTEEAFARPVHEDFPDIWPDYSQIVSEPLDFRTIEEERLPTYQAIEELRQDLCLVFRNCILFNPQRKDPLNKLATELMTSLEELFREVCNELKVLLPRRW
mmetsp:Transcript_12611/g.34970  ORF Transcript_12611/g.34970 Transcript_12611/m.34970 type:complete len:2290 (+) Transcript_12611:70-6939(+)|eukprot:CAMPEP_0168756806 /NCGR_PEP_ID=MMETSP0724-20121128/20817_1 /TAXON_ID=265536 /ORGANISM="Amphiprora sp., Strain CCMP467" /LENGTH=2289 /DNA_ID=CAMNT_0008805549 /DNA_START=11 /DNA_END=6880 /DNA_ORIENTATION=+